jgi:hypothetical protein
MPVTHNLAQRPAAERDAAQARLLACRLRHNLKGMALTDWKKDTRAKLDKMAEPMRGMVAAELNRMGAQNNKTTSGVTHD